MSVRGGAKAGRTSYKRRMRRFASVTTSAALALTLVACGGSSDPQSSASSSAAAAEGQTSYPLTIKTPWGETTLDKRPERIAAIGWSDYQLITALGVAPIAAPQSTVNNEVWVDKALQDKVELKFGTKGSGNDAVPPLEQIAAARPDLLLYSGRDLASNWSQVSQIAPIVASTTEADVSTPNWRERLRQVAIAVDRKDRGERAISDVDKHFDEVKKAHPEFAGKTVTFAVYYGPNVGLRYFSGAGSDTAKLLSSMGFKASPNADQFTGRNLMVSSEQMGLLDSDVLLVSDNSNGSIGALTDSAAFKSLPVVADGRAVVITNNATGTQPDISYTVNGQKKPGNLPWALAQPGPQSTPWASDQLAPIVAEVLAK